MYARVAGFIKARKDLTADKLEGLEEIVMDSAKVKAIADASKSSMGEIQSAFLLLLSQCPGCCIGQTLVLDGILPLERNQELRTLLQRHSVARAWVPCHLNNARSQLCATQMGAVSSQRNSDERGSPLKLFIFCYLVTVIVQCN